MQLQGDIKLFYTDVKPGNLKVDGSDLVNEPGLETAVLISILSERRAEPDDILPNPTDTRSGWWADAISDIPIGSKLWLLSRSKINNTTLRNAEQYLEESLEWMITDGVADSITATAVRGVDQNTVNFTVLITRENTNSIFFKFFLNWQSQIIGGI